MPIWGWLGGGSAFSGPRSKTQVDGLLFGIVPSIVTEGKRAHFLLRTQGLQLTGHVAPVIHGWGGRGGAGSAVPPHAWKAGEPATRSGDLRFDFRSACPWLCKHSRTRKGWGMRVSALEDPDPPRPPSEGPLRFSNTANSAIDSLQGPLPPPKP